MSDDPAIAILAKEVKTLDDVYNDIVPSMCNMLVKLVRHKDGTPEDMLVMLESINLGIIALYLRDSGRVGSLHNIDRKKIRAAVSRATINIIKQTPEFIKK